jgi:hypothetical protein
MKLISGGGCSANSLWKFTDSEPEIKALHMTVELIFFSLFAAAANIF